MEIYVINYRNVHGFAVSYSAFADIDDAHEQVEQLYDSADWIGYEFWIERVIVYEPPKKKIKLG